MKRALVDDSVRSKLAEFNAKTELCDKDGHVLGIFTPATGVPRINYDHIASLISDEELERRKHELGGKTTAELLQHLQSL